MHYYDMHQYLTGTQVIRIRKEQAANYANGSPTIGVR